jgi:hypothetical protein
VVRKNRGKVPLVDVSIPDVEMISAEKEEKLAVSN